MGATANEIYRKIHDLQNGLVELRAMLADIEIGDSKIEGQVDRPRTGWRFVRGSHSGTYVRDPDGTDRLPQGYDMTEYDHPHLERDVDELAERRKAE